MEIILSDIDCIFDVYKIGLSSDLSDEEFKQHIHDQLYKVFLNFPLELGIPSDVIRTFYGKSR